MTPGAPYKNRPPQPISISKEPRKSVHTANPYFMRRGKGQYEFVDTDMEKVRFSHVVGETYQAIRRIQRCVVPQAEVFLVCKSEELQKEVKKLFPGIKPGRSIEITIGSSKENEESALTPQERLCRVLLSIEPDVYTKAQIADLAEISKPNLAKYLMDVQIQNLVHAGVIEMEYRNIRKLK